MPAYAVRSPNGMQLYHCKHEAVRNSRKHGILGKYRDQRGITLNIRKFRESDIESLIHIWLSGSVGSHSFIDASYWHSKREAMASTYLPASDTYVLEEDGEPIGFISMVETYLAALFVDPTRQSRGYGTLLLDHVKAENEQIHLNVYQKNARAVQFYLHNGFTIASTGRDDETREHEYRMTWERQKESRAQ